MSTAINHEHDERVFKALAESRACRNGELERPLYELADCWPPATYAGSLPHMSPYFGSGTSERHDFAKQFKASAPELADFPFKEHSMVLAGGAVSTLLFSRTEPADFDIFLIGDACVRERITALGDHLALCGSEVTVHRTASCITFTVKERGSGSVSYDSVASDMLIVQVILRSYPSPAHVLYGFDLGSSAFLWDGERVQTDVMGRFAAKFGMNIVCLDGRRPTYETRICRYFNRGFGLILPNLNPLALMNHGGHTNVVLPLLSAVNANVKNNRIQVGYLRHKEPLPKKTGELRPAVDEDYNAVYENGTHGFPYGNEESLVGQNLLAIAAGKGQYCFFERYRPGLDCSEISTLYSADTVTQLLTTAVGHDGRVSISAVFAVLGEELGRELLASFSTEGAEPDIASFASRRLAELEQVEVSVPFRVRGHREGTTFDGTATMTPEAWYGEWYMARD